MYCGEVSGVQKCRIIRHGAFCSYTNNFARDAKTCQAPFASKTALAA